MNDIKVLLINDITGYGRVSTLAMLPVFSHYGLHPYVLPTALVSNATDYGSCEILDTTEFMKSCIKKWDDFGFYFENICTGFINSNEQVDIICDLIKKQSAKCVIVDPIMADNGNLYEGMHPCVIECNRKLASYADVLIPNLTEAELLADKFIGRSSLTDLEYVDLVNTLALLGAKKIIITGCRQINGDYFNLVFDGTIKRLKYNHINESFVGTGDLFSACFTSELLKGSSIEESASKSADIITKIINENINIPDKYDLNIEKCLQFLY